jgi:hypothetical protein
MIKENNDFLIKSLKDLAKKYVNEVSILHRIVNYLDGLNQNETVDVKWIFYEIIKNQKISDLDREILKKIGIEYL